MAEFNLLDDHGNTLPRTGWQASADSVELAGENGAAANAIDGNPATFWHTQWQAASPPHPHSLVVDLGTTARLAGFRYLPRAGGGNGTIALYHFYVSDRRHQLGQPGRAAATSARLGATPRRRLCCSRSNRAPNRRADDRHTGGAIEHARPGGDARAAGQRPRRRRADATPPADCRPASPSAAATASSAARRARAGSYSVDGAR